MLSCKRSEFSLPPDITYLNGAYMSPLPNAVVNAGLDSVKLKANPTNITPPDFFSGTDRIRTLFARLVNAPDPTHVAVIPAVSYAMGMVSHNLTCRAGQNIVTLDQQFPSNMYPWRRQVADDGAELRVVASPLPLGEEGRAEAWNDAVLDAIDEATALVALPNVHWTDGTHFDLEAIGARARKMGALLAVDGTQSVGAMPFDVQAVQPDLLACAAYKWLLGPYSIGAAYVGSRLQDAVPLEETWMGRKGSEEFGGLVDYEDQYRPGALRHDVGEASNFALTPMLIAALEQLQRWGVNNIAAYCAELTSAVHERLEPHGYRVNAVGERAPHLFGIGLPEGADPRALQERLACERVFVSVRGQSVRVAPNVYNDAEDIDRLVEVLANP